MTLKELAERMNLTEATVQKYEAGNIRTLDILKLKKFSEVLNVSMEDLTPWEEDYKNLETNPNQGSEEAKIVKLYSQLTFGHKKAVRSLMESLIECQERYSSDK